MLDDLGTRPRHSLAARGRAWPVEAVLFDMDGLLLDMERLALRSLADAAAGMGIGVPEGVCHGLAGLPADARLRLMQDRFGPRFPAADLLAEADYRTERSIEDGALRLKPGVPELLGRLECLGLRKAVTTSAGRIRAESHLRRAGILSRFEVVVTRDDVDRARPHPDLSLRAAAELGASPAGCLVLSASCDGIRAARAAGSMAVLVPDHAPPTPGIREACLMILPDLNTLRPLLRGV